MNAIVEKNGVIETGIVNYPWAVNYYNGIKSYELGVWLYSNVCRGGYEMGFKCVFFKNKEDAVMYYMVWCGNE